MGAGRGGADRSRPRLPAPLRGGRRGVQPVAGHPGSAPGGRNARSYTVTGLENGTRYAFELRVRRGSGVGTATKIRQTPEEARWSVSTNRRSVHEGEDVTLSIATRNAVGFYSAPEPLTLAVMGRIVLEFTTIEGADPEDFEIRVDGTHGTGIHEGHHVPQLRQRSRQGPVPRTALRRGGSGRFNVPGRDRHGACRRRGGRTRST